MIHNIHDFLNGSSETEADMVNMANVSFLEQKSTKFIFKWTIAMLQYFSEFGWFFAQSFSNGERHLKGYPGHGNPVLFSICLDEISLVI